MKTNYQNERELVVQTIDDLIHHGHLECNGGAVALRLADGNMMMTPTGAAVRRWRTEPEDLIVMTMQGDVVERGQYTSAASTLQCLMLLRAFPDANAIVHSHSPWSLTYAALGVSIPSAITSFDRYGDVPCIRCDDQELKRRFKEQPWPVEMPAAMLPRPEVAAVGEWVASKAVDVLASRTDELTAHGLAFTMYRHGIVVFAKSLERAVQDLTAIEANARIAQQSSVLRTAIADPGSDNPS
ncbi:class II aldolase/adducin family protein [Streptacidiphilus sp. P02-A3a]|uniref:class II aldolase/adducin family protein n=1 Tax=Streptacidiphilus sp. P02-A3a TaxID=2704468 RepID=UPI0015F7FF9E|nr:class II aldolase/adducin family protein [Streptacidiphilus sp. P02-A3a]QMU67197.1 class II aldolase/adducin family protein [Streptacidiphilus sp. P02-A3a]